MTNKQNDPYLSWINRMKTRIEQTTILFIFVMHLFLLTALSLFLFFDHVYKMRNDMEKPPSSMPVNQPANTPTNEPSDQPPAHQPVH